MDLLYHFQHHWRYRHMKTLPRAVQGRVIQESSDYILGTDRRHFEMVEIRGVRNYPSDQLFLWNRIFFSITEAGHQCDTGSYRHNQEQYTEKQGE